eukprot:2203228-Amphidinium_carterae.2
MESFLSHGSTAAIVPLLKPSRHLTQQDQSGIQKHQKALTHSCGHTAKASKSTSGPPLVQGRHPRACTHERKIMKMASSKENDNSSCPAQSTYFLDVQWRTYCAPLL